MSNDETLKRDTRQVMHELHLMQLDDATVTDRMTGMLSPEYLAVDDDFFHGKVCGDFGCGSAVHGVCNLLNMGAKHVHGMDVDDSFMPTAKVRLGSEDKYTDRWSLDIGSVLSLPYEDDYFDFILFQGVIHHTSDQEQALVETFRTLKPGGAAYITVNGEGGLLNHFVMDLMRKEYRTSDVFKNIIDNDLSAAWAKEQLDYLSQQIENDGSSSYSDAITLLSSFGNLFDEDLVQTIRDRLQAPTYQLFSEEEFAGMLNAVGFSSWRRVAKAPNYKNMRKIVAPLYKNFEHPLARLLYGNGGVMNFVVTK